jgi:FO synthase
VIVQNFRAVEGCAMARAPEPDAPIITDAVALARLILDREVSLQAPPNLNPSSTEALLAAGVNDFGGISPVTPDYINPRHPWPHLDALAAACRRAGFVLRPRPPIYDRFVGADWLDERLWASTRAVQTRLAAVAHPAELLPSAPRVAS